MNSKGAGAVTGEQDRKGGFLPKLRFPEFSGDWNPTELTPYLKEHSERVPSSTSVPIYSSTRSGLKPQNEYFDGVNLANDGEYRIVPEGYFTFRHMSDDGTFKFNVNNTSSAIAVSKEYPVFTAVGLSAEFLLYILNNSADFARFALMQKKGGTRTRLYLSTLRTWTPLLPSIGEQKKIADCLSSIDALIAAEAEKLEALKDHKKGLMQHLFPAPGETTPRLRFPEFRDAADWHDKPLDAVCEMKAGKFVAAADISEQPKDGLHPCYGGNGLRGYTRTYTHSGQFSLIGRQGALCGNVNFVMGEFHATEHAIVTKPKAGILGDWLYHALVRLNLNDFATGQAQPGLSVDVLEKVLCPTPRDEHEQQLIATCMSSADSVIAAQADRVAALRVHKSGLMQQFFPSQDKTEA
ncbi:restriction endonuclease subunit S [Altererythrobacter sp. H2]|uniref:restriction endonuclease subunit S n=1 Tax=Altererythrobacter sp. H2 TaxID=3108391 RepID=UPI002B4C0D52|nr:restriction endonuclease subunit S [Altererythrobacter sp. H2]WRK94497.1 restriction endonuclease subunit S [Altererythrobacter sp. H2]